MTTQPVPLNFDDALQQALTLQAQGVSIEEIGLHYPEHKDELQQLLHLPAQFSVELEQTVPSRDVFHAILAKLPVTTISPPPPETAQPKKRRTSLFTLLTYWISDSMQLSKVLIAALVTIFIIGGVVLYRQLHNTSSVSPISVATTPVPSATAKPTVNPATMKSSANADIIANQLLEQAVDNASAIDVTNPDDSKESSSAQTTDQGFANLQ